ncbi:PREDICTED: small membrane A-kinase anchor protein isoform X1 [Calidris pugnax]|uniref:small membrane A-kinase anchor protein isoform X1 n=1 Tax=Calidris pugnax TaxID=198806 RepID=UPI00071E1C7E|nr:PREDICTED: small membrane A-kinase anchor protein isoform X1 [Calidris pugnax]
MVVSALCGSGSGIRGTRRWWDGGAILPGGCGGRSILLREFLPGGRRRAAGIAFGRCSGHRTPPSLTALSPGREEVWAGLGTSGTTCQKQVQFVVRNALTLAGST